MGVFAALPDQGPENVEHCCAAESEETPFVVCVCYGADETHDDHGHVQEEGEEEFGEGQSGGEEEDQEYHGGVDEPFHSGSVSHLLRVVGMYDIPLHIADPEDLTGKSFDSWRSGRMLEFD